MDGLNTACCVKHEAGWRFFRGIILNLNLDTSRDVLSPQQAFFTVIIRTSRGQCQAAVISISLLFLLITVITAPSAPRSEILSLTEHFLVLEMFSVPQSVAFMNKNCAQIEK